MPAICSVLGCGKTVVAKGLCDTHRKRLARHGRLTSARPEDWGKREKHSLYTVWTQMRRTGRSPICERWADFWKFVEDVGQRPERAVLQRPDTEQPYGPTNYAWREPMKLVVNSSEENAAYQRAWRKMQPEKALNSELKRRFGITYENYQQRLRQQAGVCAICKKTEVSKVGRLAVDHNHRTGKIRALLCSNCNRGLGCFKDSSELLQAAVIYLKEYHEEVCTEGESCEDGSQSQGSSFGKG